MLVESKSRKSDEEWQGRSCTNKTVVFPAHETAESAKQRGFSSAECGPGDYAIVKVDGIHASTLRGFAVERTTLEGSAARIAELEQLL